MKQEAAAQFEQQLFVCCKNLFAAAGNRCAPRLSSFRQACQKNRAQPRWDLLADGPALVYRRRRERLQTFAYSIPDFGLGRPGCSTCGQRPQGLA